MKAWIDVLEKEGFKVYYPVDMKQDLLKTSGVVREKFVKGVTLGYFEYIKKADVMLLFNQNRYAGVSTTLELGYAVALAKPIFSIDEDPELARQVLFEKVVNTPDEFITEINKL
jgi:nucleoside 2-deoxyribosyltransferase